jgi:nitrite reductase/ring-hydroxylating ferredoxin subunit/multimeric flavodoxin WrbA
MEFKEVLSSADLPEGSQKIVSVGAQKVALFHYDGVISAIGNSCLHKAGPLGQGVVSKKYDGMYVMCPWHGYEYNIRTGLGIPGYEDQQSVYEVKTENGKIFISEKPVVKAKAPKHTDNPLEDLEKLKYETTGDSLNVLGISTTNMNDDIARPSTSEDALIKSLAYAKEKYNADTRLIKLRRLEFRHCEGYYSRHQNACTWPCSISEMNPDDGMNEVYRKMILWADVMIVATPIRWGNASSLYFKMAERLNCVQNQITLKDRVLIKNKVAGFIITGGQDNVQQVAAQLMVFFTDLGFNFPPFSFVGWSRGWTAEDMENNTRQFAKSKYIDRSVKELIENSVCLSRQLKKNPVHDTTAPLPKIEDAAGMMKTEEN